MRVAPLMIACIELRLKIIANGGFSLLVPVCELGLLKFRRCSSPGSSFARAATSEKFEIWLEPVDDFGFGCRVVVFACPCAAA
jgi:hypothetical protein